MGNVACLDLMIPQSGIGAAEHPRPIAATLVTFAESLSKFDDSHSELGLVSHIW